MKITVERDTFSDVSTTGKLYIDGVHDGIFTLEDTDRFLDQGGEKVYGKTAIPAGTYQVDVTWSPHFNRRLPILLDVPGFAGVRIHTGNDPDDTEGCLLVGLSREGSFVGNSRLAFSRLFPLIDDAIRSGEGVTLEVVRV